MAIVVVILLPGGSSIPTVFKYVKFLDCRRKDKQNNIDFYEKA